MPRRKAPKRRMRKADKELAKKGLRALVAAWTKAH